MKNTRTNPFAPRQYGSLVKITDRVYLFRNTVNSSIVIGDKGVAVIDTQVNQMMGHRLLQTVRALTDKPILYAVNTHYHWDHTNGNNIFKGAGATIVSRELTKDFIVNRAPRQEAFLRGRGFVLGDPPFVPELTFDSEMELDIGNQPLHLVNLGSAETDDATAIRVPAEECIIAGDTIMTGSFPIFGQPVMDEGLMANHDWIETIRELQSYGPECVLPGHGPLAREAEIDLLIKIEEYFITEVRKHVDRGMSLHQIIAEMEANFPDWITSIAEVWGTPRYAILRVYRALVNDPEPGWQHLKPSAIPAADADKLQERLSEIDGFAAYEEAAEEVVEGDDPGLAVAIAKAGVEKYPYRPDAWTAYADILTKASRVVSSVLEKGDFFFEAEIALKTALELDPHYAPAHLLRGFNHLNAAYRNGHDTKPGLESVQKALADGLQGTQLAQAHFSIGLAHRIDGDETSAHEAFAKALAADPAYMPALLANRA